MRLGFKQFEYDFLNGRVETAALWAKTLAGWNSTPPRSLQRFFFLDCRSQSSYLVCVVKARNSGPPFQIFSRYYSFRVSENECLNLSRRFVYWISSVSVMSLVSKSWVIILFQDQNCECRSHPWLRNVTKNVFHVTFWVSPSKYRSVFLLLAVNIFGTEGAESSLTYNLCTKIVWTWLSEFGYFVQLKVLGPGWKFGIWRTRVPKCLYEIIAYVFGRHFLRKDI